MWTCKREFGYEGHRRGQSRVVYSGVNAVVIVEEAQKWMRMWGLLVEKRWNENHIQRR